MSAPAASTLVVALLFLPLVGAILVWLPPLARSGVDPTAQLRAIRLQNYLTTATSFGSLALVLLIAARYRGPLRVPVLGVDLYLDSLSIYFLVLVTFVALISSCYTGPAWRRRLGTGAVPPTVFFSLFNLFLFTMVLVPMVSNLVVLWIGIELTTVTSTILVAAERTREHFEAAWKYIIITSTGIIFALLGTLFLASAIPSEDHQQTMSWPSLLSIAHRLDPNLARLSFLFILLGYGAKAGFAPMHTWLPDAHGQAPYPVSALLSGVLLKSGLYVILRFLTITNAALTDHGLFTSRMLISIGLLSMLTATPLILKRNPFKRVLAYHSLQHMGIITIGIGIGGPVALFGALLHMLNHGVTKSLLFLAFGNVQENFPPPAGPAAAPLPQPAAEATTVDEDDRASEYRGVLRALPWTGSLMALGGLALVGSPPFSIFLSEFLILWGGIRRIIDEPTPWLIIALVAFLVSVTLIFAGLVRHLGRLLMGPPNTPYQRESPMQVVPLLGLFAVIVLLGLVIPGSGPLNLQRILQDSVTIVCSGRCS
jgi:hydrogenase-4 component F